MALLTTSCIGNLASTFLTLNSIHLIEVIPRQNGKTISTVALILWLYKFCTTNSSFIFCNKAEGDVKVNLNRFKTMMEMCLLPWLREPESNFSTYNTEVIKHTKTNNDITIVCPGVNAESSDRKGRGLTAPFMWADEWAFTPFNGELYESASLTLSKAGEAARRNGKPSGKIFTTTPKHHWASL